MQEKNKKIFNLLKKFKKIHFSFGADGDRDWATLLTVSVLIFIASIAFGGVMFYEVKYNKADVGIVNEDETQLINEKDLLNIIQRYEEKKKRFDGISNQ